MRIATATLESVAAYSQSKPVMTPRGDETHEEHEERTWQERCHVGDDGKLFIPPMAFANNIKEAAKYANIKIPGQRNATYTKRFVSGVMVVDPLPLNIELAEVDYDYQFVPSDGTPGGGKRVWKYFPRIDTWHGDVNFYVLDDIIGEDVFAKVLRVGGAMIGIGRFRPANRGYYGRFNVIDIKWSETDV